MVDLHFCWSWHYYVLGWLRRVQYCLYPQLIEEYAKISVDIRDLSADIATVGYNYPNDDPGLMADDDTDNTERCFDDKNLNSPLHSFFLYILLFKDHTFTLTQ